MEKENTNFPDQEEVPIAIEPEGFIPYMVENFEKKIQDQVTENTQVPTGHVVGTTVDAYSINAFKKICESLF